MTSRTRIERATFEEIGTVFGLAMDQSTGDLYAGAYQKRFAGLKDASPARSSRSRRSRTGK